MKDFQSVLDDYWDAAYREGEERRILDDGVAQEALSWLQAYSREAESNKARVAELEAAHQQIMGICDPDTAPYRIAKQAIKG